MIVLAKSGVLRLQKGSRRDNSQVRRWKRLLVLASLLAAYSVALGGLGWFAATRLHEQHAAVLTPEPIRQLWAALFGGPANCYIVPADAGFNLLEDLLHHPMPLALYMKGSYLNLPLPQIDGHSAEDLRAQQFTSFTDLQIVTALARLPEFNPQRAILRFPRELRLDDLKHANAIILGSMGVIHGLRSLKAAPTFESSMATQCRAQQSLTHARARRRCVLRGSLKRACSRNICSDCLSS